MDTERGTRTVDKWILGILSAVIAAVIIDGYRDSNIMEDRIATVEKEQATAAVERRDILKKLESQSGEINKLNEIYVSIARVEGNITTIMTTQETTNRSLEKVLTATESLGRWQNIRQQGIDKVLETYKAE